MKQIYLKYGEGKTFNLQKKDYRRTHHGFLCDALTILGYTHASLLATTREGEGKVP